MSNYLDSIDNTYEDYNEKGYGKTYTEEYGRTSFPGYKYINTIGIVPDYLKNKGYSEQEEEKEDKGPFLTRRNSVLKLTQREYYSRYKKELIQMGYSEDDHFAMNAIILPVERVVKILDDVEDLDDNVQEEEVGYEDSNSKYTDNDNGYVDDYVNTTRYYRMNKHKTPSLRNLTSYKNVQLSDPNGKVFLLISKHNITTLLSELGQSGDVLTREEEHFRYVPYTTNLALMIATSLAKFDLTQFKRLHAEPIPYCDFAIALIQYFMPATYVSNPQSIYLENEDWDAEFPAVYYRLSQLLSNDEIRRKDLILPNPFSIGQG